IAGHHAVICALTAPRRIGYRTGSLPTDGPAEPVGQAGERGGAALSSYVTPRAAKSAVTLCLIVAGPLLPDHCLSLCAVGGTTANFVVMLTAVAALGVFAGNSGILSFGHCAFMALGAQISATLTVAPAFKKSAFPLLPDILLQSQHGLVAALIVTMIAVGAV